MSRAMLRLLSSKQKHRFGCCMSGALQYMTYAHKIKCSVLVYVTNVLWYSTITLTATERSMPGVSAFV